MAPSPPPPQGSLCWRSPPLRGFLCCPPRQGLPASPIIKGKPMDSEPSVIGRRAYAMRRPGRQTHRFRETRLGPNQARSFLVRCSAIVAKWFATLGTSIFSSSLAWQRFRGARCHGNVAVATLPWQRCHGARCRGNVAVATLPWQRCHDNVAAATLPWQRCRGERCRGNVAMATLPRCALPWQRPRANVAVATLPCQHCRANVAVATLPWCTLRWQRCRGNIAGEPARACKNTMFCAAGTQPGRSRTLPEFRLR